MSNFVLYYSGASEINSMPKRSLFLSTVPVFAIAGEQRTMIVEVPLGLGEPYYYSNTPRTNNPESLLKRPLL